MQETSRLFAYGTTLDKRCQYTEFYTTPLSGKLVTGYFVQNCETFKVPKPVRTYAPNRNNVDKTADRRPLHILSGLVKTTKPVFNRKPPLCLV